MPFRSQTSHSTPSFVVIRNPFGSSAAFTESDAAESAKASINSTLLPSAQLEIEADIKTIRNAIHLRSTIDLQSESETSRDFRYLASALSLSAAALATLISPLPAAVRMSLPS